jgi:hypothetical protein
MWTWINVSKLVMGSVHEEIAIWWLLFINAILARLFSENQVERDLWKIRKIISNWRVREIYDKEIKRLTHRKAFERRVRYKNKNKKARKFRSLICIYKMISGLNREVNTELKAFIYLVKRRGVKWVDRLRRWENTYCEGFLSEIAKTKECESWVLNI